MKTLRARPQLKSKMVTALAVAGSIGLSGCASKKEVVKPVEPVTTVQPVEPTAEEHEYAGVQALKAGDRATAKERFAKALEKNPQLVTANYNMAFLAQQDGDLDGAARGYQAVLAVDPDHEPALLNLGKVYRDQMKYEEGTALFEKAVEKKPHDVTLLNNLSVFYRLSKRYDDAIATARKLLSRTKDNADAYKNLALIAYDQGNIPLAKTISENALKLEEKLAKEKGGKVDPGVYNNLGLVYLKLGQRRTALAQFRKAVEQDENFAPGHANIGAMALSYRDYETAAKSFETVTRLEPTNATAWLNLGWAYEGFRTPDGMHKTKEAVTAFEKVLSLVKDQPDAIYGIAKAYAGELKDLPKARSFYERYLALADAPLREKAQRELQMVNQRIEAGLQAQQMREEMERKQREEEERRRQEAMEKAKQGGESMLDKVASENEEAEVAPEAMGEDGEDPEGAPAAGTDEAPVPASGSEGADAVPAASNQPAASEAASNG